MVNQIKTAINKQYLWGSLLILFFFLRGGEFLLNNHSPNWAYIFDQFGLIIFGSIFAYTWFKRKNLFSLGWKYSIFLIVIVLVSHYHSFYRPFWFDELRNIIPHLEVLHGYHGNPSVIEPHFTGQSVLSREKYAWSVTTLAYELVGINHSYSLFVYASLGILLIVGASLSTAWLTGLISESKLAALIAGILVGVSTNGFMDMIWVSNIQMDALGVILVTFSVGVWFTARKTKDKKGIFIALILLAATLKGGGVVRTSMTGGLLILTDMLFFPEIIKKGGWFDWLKVFIVTGAFNLINSVHWQPASTPSSTTMDFGTRLGFLADATTRSFVPPLMLVSLINQLRALSYMPTWTVVIGTILFIVGTSIAVFTFFRPKYRYFTWGFAWFYVCIWYVPWLAELYSKPNDNVSDINFAGYKYAYLSLVGIYIALGILLSQQIIKVRFNEQKQKLLGLFFALLTAGILVYRLDEFVKLDYHWRTEYSTRVSAWYNLVFETFTPPTGPVQKQSTMPFALVELDNDHIGMEAELFIPLLYYDGSLLFYRDPNLFYKEAILEKKIPFDRVYAIVWNPNKQKVFNVTTNFRNFLSSFENKPGETPDFNRWKRNL